MPLDSQKVTECRAWLRKASGVRSRMTTQKPPVKSCVGKYHSGRTAILGQNIEKIGSNFLAR
jgi:hypothetical protein